MSQADWDRLQYYSRRVKYFEAEDEPLVHSSTYLRIAQFQSSALFPSLRRLQYNLDDRSNTCTYFYIFLFQSPLLESLEFFHIKDLENTTVGPFLATLSSQTLRRIVLRDGWMDVDILEKSIVHFKQLQSLELLNAVFMDDFALLEVLGSLPSLENLTLVASDPASHPTPEKSNSQSGGPRYFDALESLHVTGSFFLIQHLLGFIDSPLLNSIEVFPAPNENETDSEDLFTPSMTIITAKWSQSLKNLLICSKINYAPPPRAVSKCLKLLRNLHKMQTFRLDWRMKNLNDDIRRLVMSWPKLRILNLNQTLISLSTLRIIAENCPELRHLHIRLSTSTIPPFDASNSLSLRHNLEVLTLGRANPSSNTQTMESQIQVTRHLDLIFPYLTSIEVKSNDVFWEGIRDLIHLCQDASLSRG